MNETTLTQLKILVERAVRPVRAPSRRKLKMREELLAHVVGVYEEESARPGTAAETLERVRQRFGDPAELTISLQATVPWLERLAGHLQYHLCRRPSETPLRFAVRHACAAGFMVGGAGLVGFLVFLLMVLTLQGAREPQPWDEVVVVGLMAPAMFLLAGIAVFLGHGLWHSLPGASGRSWLRSGLILLASAMVGPLLVLGISLQMCGELSRAIHDARPGLTLAVLLPPFGLIFLIDLIRRVSAGLAARSWLYIIAVDTCLAVVLSLMTFGLALIVTGDSDLSFEHARVMACMVMTWLLPLDLIVTAPSVAARLRLEREWANLPIQPERGVMP